MVGKKGLKTVGGPNVIRHYIVDQKLFSRSKEAIKSILDHFDLDPRNGGKIDGYISQFNRWMRQGRAIELIRNLPRRNRGRPKPDSLGAVGVRYVLDNYDYDVDADRIDNVGLYRATKTTEPNLGKVFALKSCRRQSEMQMEESIAVALRNDSRYLSILYCAFPVLEGFGLVHNYHIGGDLWQKIQSMHVSETEVEEFTQQEVQIVMAELIVGLKKLHAAGFVHRDIKPSNVMIDSHGHVTIIDFGMAKRRSEMIAHKLAGTVPYFSPEMITDAPIPPGCECAQDWWALGVLLHDLVEQIVLFDGGIGDTDQDIMNRILNQHIIPTLADKPTDRVFKGLLNWDVEARMAFVADIESQPFFNGINWDDVRQGTIAPPFTA